MRKLIGQMPNANPGVSILCEPAQSKRHIFFAETYGENVGC